MSAVGAAIAVMLVVLILAGLLLWIASMLLTPDQQYEVPPVASDPEAWRLTDPHATQRFASAYAKVPRHMVRRHGAPTPLREQWFGTAADRRVGVR